MINLLRTVAITVLAVAGLAMTPASGSAQLWIGVRGNQLVNGKGHEVRLLGVNRSGTEYKCADEEGFFEGPSDMPSIEAMKSWHINSVRVPLNESCWLGLGGIDPAFSGSAYRAAIAGYVAELQSVGLYVILDLHWAAPEITEPAASSRCPTPTTRSTSGAAWQVNSAKTAA